MKIFHYSSPKIDSIVGSRHVPLQDYGKSNTDTTFWRPDVHTTREFANGHGSVLTPLYDFPDGKDTGERLNAYLRVPSRDVTEVDEALRNVERYIDDKKAIDKENLEAEIKKAEDLKNVVDSSNKSE